MDQERDDDAKETSGRVALGAGSSRGQRVSRGWTRIGIDGGRERTTKETNDTKGTGGRVAAGGGSSRGQRMSRGWTRIGTDGGGRRVRCQGSGVGGRAQR